MINEVLEGMHTFLNLVFLAKDACAFQGGEECRVIRVACVFKYDGGFFFVFGTCPHPEGAHGWPSISPDFDDAAVDEL